MVANDCQHLTVTCDISTGRTPTAHTSEARFRNFRCADCGVPLYAVTPQGKTTTFVNVPLVTEQRTGKEVPSVPEKKPLIGDGPGKELMLIFSGLGVPSCQSCTDLATKMNKQGVEWCEANVDAIVADIMPRAQEWLSRPEGGWTDKLKARAPQFAQSAVLRRYVGLALRNWTEKQELIGA